MEQRISHFLQKYVTEVYFPNIRITDIVEVLILTFLIYQLMIWVKNTKAWMLMKGILVLAVFILVAAIFQMHTILFLAKNAVTVMATAASKAWSFPKTRFPACSTDFRSRAPAP